MITSREADSSPVNRLPAPPGRLYYQTHVAPGIPVTHYQQRNFLPAIWSAINKPSGTERVDGAWKSDITPLKNIECILDMLAVCLQPRAIQYWNPAYHINVDLDPPRTAFAEPLTSNHDPP